MSTVATKSTFITIREAARRLGVHENTVRRYADRGLIRAIRLPSGVRRVRRADIEALDAVRAKPEAPQAGISVDRPSVTVDELIAETRARPVDDVAALARPDLWHSDEEVERFVAMTLAERERDH
jgi:excisionase family DNA binding protein